jgi:hypothetical protein
MDFVIRLVGIVMIVTTGTTTVLHRDIAMLPISDASNSFCSGNVTVVQHEAFVRINSGQVVDDRAWPEHESCDPGQGCTLYRIPVASDLSVDPGFAPVGNGIRRDTTFCLVPDIHRELMKSGHQYAALDLRNDPISATIAALELPPGIIKAYSWPPTGMVASVLWVTAPSGAKAVQIVITADARDHSATRRLVVKAGSNITLTNLPAGRPGMDLAQRGGPIAQSGMFLYNRLISKEFCSPLVDTGVCPRSVPRVRGFARPGEGTDSTDSNRACCGD